jgi:DNA-binding PadR family transcriptional regulator
MPRLNYTKYIILGLLSSAPMSGYEIRKTVKAIFIYLWDVSYGQIYPMLARLEREGLATMEVVRSGKGPEKKVYDITDKGRNVLKAWLEGPETKEYELMLKLCFGSQIEPSLLINKLEAYGKKRGSEIIEMEKWLGEIGDGTAYGPNGPFYMLITRLGLEYFKEEKAWCKASTDMLRHRP